MRWLGEVRRVGTVTDRVAAMTLLLQAGAAANMRSLDELLRWAGKRSGARAAAGQVPPSTHRTPSQPHFEYHHSGSLCWASDRASSTASVGGLAGGASLGFRSLFYWAHDGGAQS
jgi:hypothetical protein